MKKLIIAFLSLFFWIAIFEGGSFLYLKKYADPFERAKFLLYPDKTIGWRQVSNFKGQFINKTVTLDKNGFRNLTDESTKRQEKITILTLGPSSAFGWGTADNETYSYILEQKLKSFWRRDVRVINASQIGFSTFQGTLLIKNIIEKGLKPDLILMAYGVNDIDRNRFYFQGGGEDKLVLNKSNSSKSFIQERILQNSSFLRLTRRLMSKISHSFLCRPLKRFPHRRVRYRDIVSNIDEISKSFNVPTIIINTAHNYRRNSHIIFRDRAALETLLSKSHIHIDKHLESEKSDSNLWYLKSLNAGENGQCEDAQSAFKKARQLEEFRISKDIQELNRRLLHYSQKNSLIYVNIDAILQSVSTPRDHFFVDPVHPSPKGHTKIAEEIFKNIRKRWPNGIK